jgi:hypothetical protein
MSNHILNSFTAMLLACTACGTDFQAFQGGGGGGGDAGGSNSGSGGQLPCDVQSVLSDHCVSCHGNPPSNGAPISLVTYDDLIAPATGGATAAQRALVRMTSTTSPMPPAPASPVPTAQIAAFQSWVNSGTPPGTCGTNDPFSAPPTCTTGIYWTSGEGSSRMHPGEGCIGCHAASGGEAPRFSAAGTVYKTGHEPNNCFGSSGASIVITDAHGATLSLPVNSAGNFSTQSPLAFPIRAKVVANGQERAMASAQMSGDCNSCHTQNGAHNAPGRIALP